MKIVIDSNDPATRRFIKKICIVTLFGILLYFLMSSIGLGIIIVPGIGLFWYAISGIENREAGYSQKFIVCFVLVAIGAFGYLAHWDFAGSIIAIVILVCVVHWAWFSFDALAKKVLEILAEYMAQAHEESLKRVEGEDTADRIIAKGEQYYDSLMGKIAKKRGQNRKKS